MDVNTALLVAQRFLKGEAFAAAALSGHFERCEDPNDLKTLERQMEELHVPLEELKEALEDPEKDGKGESYCY